MSNTPSPKRTVFVVDDEVVIADTLAMILQRAGFDAIAFHDPLEALDAADRNAPDLLITDVMMPNMNGVELATRFRESWPDCRVLLFSGQAKTADLLEKARIEGHDFDLLSKPVHPADLLKKLQS